MVVYDKTSPLVENEHVYFLNYTGDYPNLCRGILTLKIDGKVIQFGDKYKFVKSAWDKTATMMEEEYNRRYGVDIFPKFWVSGGSIGSYYNGVCQREWIINNDDIPEQYRKYACEIDRVFNMNVEWGCCGGCC